MPLYGADFFDAVRGQPDHIGLGYLKAIWYYWTHTHCEGLRDDQEFLRKVCEVERDDWAEAMAVIFDNDKFFTLDADGTWHQKRAAQEWAKAKEKYQRKVKQTSEARKKRWK